MAVTINTSVCREVIPKSLEAILPCGLCAEIRRASVSGCGRIEEIRLRCDRAVSLSTQKGNVMLGRRLCRAEMDKVLAALCDNSLYAHSDTINCGYITLPDGIRVGICGRASLEDGRVLGVYDVSSMNIRIPSGLRNVGAPVCRLLREYGGTHGVLVYSPPGVGKTTLLRGIAAAMAGGDNPRRVCVIDTRGEFSFPLSDGRLCLDILSGYPRPLGIEIAARTMNAQLMICDEIGDVGEAQAIIAAQNCGVPLVASAHASSVEGLLCRTGIRMLHDARVFGAYVGIEREAFAADYRYTVTEWRDADAVLQNIRCAHNGY